MKFGIALILSIVNVAATSPTTQPLGQADNSRTFCLDLVADQTGGSPYWPATQPFDKIIKVLPDRHAIIKITPSVTIFGCIHEVNLVRDQAGAIYSVRIEYCPESQSKAFAEAQWLVNTLGMDKEQFENFRETVTSRTRKTLVLSAQAAKDDSARIRSSVLKLVPLLDEVSSDRYTLWLTFHLQQ